MPTTLRTEVRDHLGVLRSAWDGVVTTMPLPSAFLRGWWVDHAATGRAAVVCCFDGDELVGGAAFELRTGLSPAVRAGLPRLVERLVAEIERLAPGSPGR